MKRNLNQPLDKTTQRMIEDFSSRLETMAAEQIEAFKVVTADALFRDLRARDGSAPLHRYALWRLFEVGRRFLRRMPLPRSMRQLEPRPDDDLSVAIDVPYRVLPPRHEVRRE
jgi:hypothetical protein